MPQLVSWLHARTWSSSSVGWVVGCECVFGRSRVSLYIYVHTCVFCVHGVIWYVACTILLSVVNIISAYNHYIFSEFLTTRWLDQSSEKGKEDSSRLHLNSCCNAFSRNHILLGHQRFLSPTVSCLEKTWCSRLFPSTQITTPMTSALHLLIQDAEFFFLTAVSLRN